LTVEIADQRDAETPILLVGCRSSWICGVRLQPAGNIARRSHLSLKHPIPLAGFTVPSTSSSSSDGLYLETDRGQLNISSLQSNSIQELFVKETWVTHKMWNVLWLPSEYRGTCSTVRSNVLALGQASGCVTFFEFNLPNTVCCFVGDSSRGKLS
jgi:hypothetical protein